MNEEEVLSGFTDIKSGKLAIIIYSCERNSDMWRIFSKLFRKYWPHCQYEVIVVTDCWKRKPEGVYSGEPGLIFSKIVVCNGDWAHMIKTAINAAGTPYVSLWMDDYLLCDLVQENVMEHYMEIMHRYHAANIRLVRPEWPKLCVPDKKNREIGIWKQGTAYSISTQVGIWDAEFLKCHIKDGWSAWDFERRGSLEIRDRRYPFLVALDYVFPYEEGVRKGKWMDRGIRLCERNGIKLDFRKRPRMSNWEMCKVYLKGAILDLNPTLVVKLQNKLHKLLGK